MFPLEYYISLGCQLGYPVCCISDFCTRLDRISEGKFDKPRKGARSGTGFVPCSACAEHINQIGFEDFVARHIAKHRQVEKPFPEF